MEDSDAVDEAEAAHAATRAAQDQVVSDLIASAERAQPEELVGEIMTFGRTLFYWGNEEGTDAYINLDNVSVVNMADGVLNVSVGGQMAGTEDAEVIARFWAEWEII